MEKFNIFDFIEDKHYNYKKVFSKDDFPLKLFEAFAGIGCQAMSFKKANIPYETVGISEIDKYAIQSYNAIHGKTKNYGDICKMNLIPKCDIFTWSFPCTDLSKAGKQKGLTNTRSGLVYEVLRLLKVTKDKPKVLIMENVPDLVQVKFMTEFYEIQKNIESLGYKNFTQVLNAKHYGVAQNRARVFMVSILDKNARYEFPPREKLKLRLKDYLEENVAEKYYLTEKQLKSVENTTYQTAKEILKLESISSTLCARDYKGAKIIQLGNIVENKGFNNPQNGRLYSAKGLSPAITTMGGGNRQPKIIEPKLIKELQLKNSHEQSGRVYNSNGISPTIMSNSHGKSNGGYIPTKIIDNLYKNREPREYEETCPTIKANSGCLMVAEATKKGYALAKAGDGVYINRPHQKRGVVQKGMIQTLKTSGNDIGVVVNSNIKNINSDNEIQTALGTNCGSSTSTGGGVVKTNLHIRKLTPRECWRLMGIDDKSFYNAKWYNPKETINILKKAKKNKKIKLIHKIINSESKSLLERTSNSQLYKQAGNGIVVDVFAKILKGLVK